MSLPAPAQREDTLVKDHFREWIATHIESWFALTQKYRLGIRMEDILLVTGCHRTKSWSNIAFNEVRAGAQFSLGVDVAGALGARINWRVSRLTIPGALHNHGPNGEVCLTDCKGHRILKTHDVLIQNLPENQCIFVRGFRVKRTVFGTIQQIKGAAEPKPDPRGMDEPEKEVISVPSVSEVRSLSLMHKPRLTYAFQVPGSSTCTTRIYHESECCRFMLCF